ncbi:MAG: hypothetical protein K0R57_4308 [Paenibacillaceae bacterium]|jgi:hypothetical protein|nr:hypothetical protein [Paenibacillaceae bacterium]
MAENAQRPILIQRNEGSNAAANSNRQTGNDAAKININEALASQFPDWDLAPPVQLVRRKGGRFT